MNVYLSDMHAGITGQRTSRCEVIRPQKCWDDAIPVYFPDHGTIHEVNEPVLIHSNAYVERGQMWQLQIDTLHQQTGETRLVHMSRLPLWFPGHWRRGTWWIIHNVLLGGELFLS